MKIWILFKDRQEPEQKYAGEWGVPLLQAVHEQAGHTENIILNIRAVNIKHKGRGIKGKEEKKHKD